MVITNEKIKPLHWALALVFILSSLGIPGEETVATADDNTPAPTEPWQKPYKDFHALVGKLDEEISRNYIPEFMIVKEGNTIRTIQIDSFGVKVLKEADELLLPYRDAIAKCVERRQNEYRPARVYSYERFGWFLDRYVRTLQKSIGGVEEKSPSKGIRDRTVLTDRGLYTITRLAAAYLQERRERGLKSPSDGFAIDRALETAIHDVGRRVFRLDLTKAFDRKELLEKGPPSQPVFRDLASGEAVPALSLGLEPLASLMKEKDSEPSCDITMPPKAPAKEIATE